MCVFRCQLDRFRDPASHRPQTPHNPVMIADELKMNQQVVGNILLTLSELGLLATAARGVYEISEMGQQVLDKHSGKK